MRISIAHKSHRHHASIYYDAPFLRAVTLRHTAMQQRGRCAQAVVAAMAVDAVLRCLAQGTHEFPQCRTLGGAGVGELVNQWCEGCSIEEKHHNWHAVALSKRSEAVN